MKKKILIVDDTALNRSLLADILSEDYDTVEASNGLEAVALLNRQSAEISLVLLDIVMPEMDGFEVLALMNKNKWIQSIPVIMISAEISSNYIDHAYDLGATDYITRPFDEKTVQRRVQNTITLYAKQKVLEDLVTEQIMEKEQTNSQMVDILSNIVEFRNGESGMHVLHVRVITNMLLQGLRRKSPQYDLTAEKISLISNASALHDVGKIYIDEKVLNKPGRLTKEEFEHMKKHTEMGAQILASVPVKGELQLLKYAYEICRWHHERYDGRGYPDGLKGDEIPISAQVVAVADVYDALTSVRVYKPAYPHETAIKMILNGECGQFNPVLLECLLENEQKICKELEQHSPRAVTQMEMQRVAKELISHEELHVSSRMLVLLEQERIKNSFYTSISKDILFEYDVSSSVLEFSEWGASCLGITEIVTNPRENEEMAAWSSSAYIDMRGKLRAATPESPVVEGDYCLKIKGEESWFKVIARPIWNNEDDEEYSRVIGKMAVIREEQAGADD